MSVHYDPMLAKLIVCGRVARRGATPGDCRASRLRDPRHPTNIPFLLADPRAPRVRQRVDRHRLPRSRRHAPLAKATQRELPPLWRSSRDRAPGRPQNPLEPQPLEPMAPRGTDPFLSLARLPCLADGISLRTARGACAWQSQETPTRRGCLSTAKSARSHTTASGGRARTRPRRDQRDVADARDGGGDQRGRRTSRERRRHPDRARSDEDGAADQAPRNGVVKAVHCAKGDLVQPGVNLLELE